LEKAAEWIRKHTGILQNGRHATLRTWWNRSQELVQLASQVCQLPALAPRDADIKGAVVQYIAKPTVRSSISSIVDLGVANHRLTLSLEMQMALPNQGTIDLREGEDLIQTLDQLVRSDGSESGSSIAVVAWSTAQKHLLEILWERARPPHHAPVSFHTPEALPRELVDVLFVSTHRDKRPASDHVGHLWKSLLTNARHSLYLFGEWEDRHTGGHQVGDPASALLMRLRQFLEAHGSCRRNRVVSSSVSR
jgi:hypothetical protein